MSKIGRKPIELARVNVEVSGSEIVYKGQKAAGTHVLPDCLKAELIGQDRLHIIADKRDADTMRLWGLHRALLANKIKGASTGFEKQLRIVGLGFKAVVQGAKLQFSLGYSHKIDFELPAGVTVEVDKAGQLLTCRSSNKEDLGLVCSKIRELRLPEPYKGTGIAYVNEVIRRKSGKAKSA
jgi:large subunit ribosomal protein L6